jgi:RNA polymerase II subunit A small phosphatase-like protein
MKLFTWGMGLEFFIMPPRYDKLLVLDLDETLIYSVENPLERTPDFSVFNYFVYKRPGVDYFLSTCTSWFDTAVWTSAGSDYAHQIIQHIFPEPKKLQFIFTEERCNVRFDYESSSYSYVKRLKKLKKRGYPLDKVLIVDDTPETFIDNYSNAILVQKYKGEQEDEELFLLLKYLEMIGSVENVRKIEKREWRHFVF